MDGWMDGKRGPEEQAHNTPCSVSFEGTEEKIPSITNSPSPKGEEVMRLSFLVKFDTTEQTDRFNRLSLEKTKMD